MSCVSWPCRKAAASAPCGADHAPVGQRQRRRRRGRRQAVFGHAAIIIAAHVFDVQGVAPPADGRRSCCLLLAWRWQRRVPGWWLNRPLALAAPDGRAVDRARHHAARGRARLGRCRRAGLARAALRVVPLVGPGAPHPRRQLRDRARRHAAPAAGQDGAGDETLETAAPGRRLDLAPGARRAGRRAAPEAGHAGDERRRADGRRWAPGASARRPLLPGHLRLQPGRQRPDACSSAPMRAMQRRLDAAWAQRAPDTPLKSADEALILASIVEKETGPAADRGPGGRRVRQPAAHRHAAADRPDGDLRPGRGLRRQPAQARPAGRHALQHLHRAGLPPTPIAMPGAASLLAAVQPDADARRCTSWRAATAAATSATTSPTIIAR